MRPIWNYFDNILSAEECNKIIDYHKNSLMSSKVVRKKLNLPQFLKRKSEVSWILPEHDTYQMVSKVMYIIRDVAKNVHGVDINYFEPVQFARYNFLGHYGIHRDVIPDENQRIISASIELSDPVDYLGGKLWINSDGDKHPLKKQGSLIVFPSILEHKVTPVFWGTRYSLVFWGKFIK